ncbi:hypothetical protein DUNSADRAFT_7610 [Dunaliella salina]|uniref:Encoded protein n=1 Tax=Dunaliella salina TaxID=3046 RepID=A0ABQ7GKZ5_DUNSA|nr:hypothetical protein DUNSADRAFT_7610 [Dunaliella salina]|eukprot:KAF5835285.1 hypothetical protein DUNSADRAFT_7610 [Dunaliella salina]
MLLHKSSSACLGDLGIAQSSPSCRSASGYHATVSPFGAVSAQTSCAEVGSHTGSSRNSKRERDFLAEADRTLETAKERRVLQRSYSCSSRVEGGVRLTHSPSGFAYSDNSPPSQCSLPTSRRRCADIRSAFRRYLGASTNVQANAEVFPLPWHHRDVGAPETSIAKPCAAELLKGGSQAHATLPKHDESPHAFEAKTKAGNESWECRTSPKSIPVSGKLPHRASLVSQTSGSSPLPPPLPFDSDFLLGLKQQAGCSSSEGPESALLPAPLGKRGWRSHSTKDAAGDIACRIAQQASSSCRTQRDRPQSFKGLPSFIRRSKGERDLPTGAEKCVGFQPSSQVVAGLLEAIVSKEADTLRV